MASLRCHDRSPLLSGCPAVAEAVSVWPSWAVPLIEGVDTVGAASSTAALAALVCWRVRPIIVGGGRHDVEACDLVAFQHQ